MSPESQFEQTPISEDEGEKQQSSEQILEHQLSSRIRNACNSCRSRKVKCTGERPVCWRCQQYGIPCQYRKDRREKLDKRLESLDSTISAYEELLYDLHERADDSVKLQIQAAMLENAHGDFLKVKSEAPDSKLPDITPGGSSSGVSTDRTTQSQSRRQSESQERRRIDTSTTSGYIGESSEVWWLQQIRGHKSNDDVSAQAVNSVFDSSYHMDDAPVPSAAGLDIFGLPNEQEAEILFKSYMDNVQPSLPILGVTTFTSQYQKFFAHPEINPGSKWLAILNLVFAIAAIREKRYNQSASEVVGDHKTFFSRARGLGIQDGVMINHSDLQNVQIFGLTTLYLLACGQINHAWTFSGIAVRSATRLGLHLRNENTLMTNSSKEARYRLWWSIFILEQQLATLTGRPVSFGRGVYTTPLPVPYMEDEFTNDHAAILLDSECQQTVRCPQPVLKKRIELDITSGGRTKGKSREVSPTKAKGIGSLDWALSAPPGIALAFLFYIQLLRIQHATWDRVFAPGTVHSGVFDLQEAVKVSSQELDSWLQSLPPSFDFRKSEMLSAHTISLGLAYFETRILVNKPFLFIMDEATEVQASSYYGVGAQHCVEAAMSMHNLFSNVVNSTTNASGLFPWWCFVHYVVQATVILLLIMSNPIGDGQPELSDIVASIKRGIYWLHQMSVSNSEAARAWILCDQIFRGLAVKLGVETMGIPEVLPSIRRWTPEKRQEILKDGLLDLDSILNLGGSGSGIR